MKSYYAIHGTLRYYDKNITKSWPEPVHQYFINLNLNPKSLVAFTKRFGPLFWTPDVTLPEAVELLAEGMRARESSLSGGPPFLSIPGFWESYYGNAQERQRVLRKAWRGEKEALTELNPDNMWPLALAYYDNEESPGSVTLKIDIGPNGIDFQAKDVWSYIRFAFLFDYQRGKAKICANQDCSTPYFLQTRKRQLYCSHECAVLINVRRFRERAKQRGKKGRRSQKARRK